MDGEFFKFVLSSNFHLQYESYSNDTNIKKASVLMLNIYRLTVLVISCLVWALYVP